MESKIEGYRNEEDESSLLGTWSTFNINKYMNIQNTARNENDGLNNNENIYNNIKNNNSE